MMTWVSPVFHNYGEYFLVRRRGPAISPVLVGIVDVFDDGDQYEGVTDFYVITGGTGQMSFVLLPRPGRLRVRSFLFMKC